LEVEPMAKNLKFRDAKQVQRKVANRWTPMLVEQGWTPVSDFFLKNYHRLSPPITNSEAMLIIHLMLHKWDAEAPYPSFRTLAERMGMTVTAARGHARHLDSKGYMHRQKQVGKTNRFFLEPLFEALERLCAADAKKGQKESA